VLPDDPDELMRWQYSSDYWAKTKYYLFLVGVILRFVAVLQFKFRDVSIRDYNFPISRAIYRGCKKMYTATQKSLRKSREDNHVQEPVAACTATTATTVSAEESDCRFSRMTSCGVDFDSSASVSSIVSEPSASERTVVVPASEVKVRFV